ncbi:MAG TPA: YetF domain-containing protein [Novosphingobium sp.]|nr:YetF domain-containing protein [Novosphingobium sp.]
MEIVIRASVMFLLVYALLRLMGKRELGQMAPFELVSLIVMGDLIQQGVTHQDFSLTGATLAIFTFAAWSFALGLIAHRIPKMRRALKSRPVVLIRDGKLLPGNLDEERIDNDELAIEMRLAGISSLNQIAWAILEPEGKISFIRKDDTDPDPRTGDDTQVA